MTKKAYWAKFDLFQAKYPNFSGLSKSFGTQLTEKPPRHLVWIVFLVGYGIKWAKNADNWPKMPVLGKIWPFLAQKPFFWGKE